MLKKFEIFSAFSISFFLYFTAASLGLLAASINKQASPVWPATGIAIALLLFLNFRAALAGIFFAAMLANLQTGLNFPAAFMIAIGNSLEGLFFVLVYRNFSQKGVNQSPHVKFILAVASLAGAAMVSATVGTFALRATSVISSQLIVKNWITWWVGDYLGGMFIIPIAHRIKNLGLSIFRLNFKSAVILLLYFSILSVFTYWLFNAESVSPFLFVLFPLLLLIAESLDVIWLYLACVLICIFAVVGTFNAQGPFVGASLNESLIHLQIFLAGLILTAVGISSLKQLKFGRAPKFALIFGWLFSGFTFYYSYSSSLSKDKSIYKQKILEVSNRVDERFKNYLRMLESGVSFINASNSVSKKEWKVFAGKILSTNRYPGVEGVGVIYSSTIRNRLKDLKEPIFDEQTVSQPHSVANLSDDKIVKSADDKFIIYYVEPEEHNKKAIGLNISSEKHRYEAAIKARDSGLPAVSEEIQLVQDNRFRPGFLLYVPIYQTDKLVNDVESRRKHFIGFVYAPVLYEHFIQSVVKEYEEHLLFKFFLSKQDGSEIEVYSTPTTGSRDQGFDKEASIALVNLAGTKLTARVTHALGFEYTKSLVSSWISFFGAILSLSLAIMLSSLENLALHAQRIAAEMNKELNRQKRKWQALTETSPVGIYIADLSGKCTYVNPSWCKMSGLTEEQAYKNWSNIVHPDDRALVKEQWDKLLNGGSFKCEYRYLKPQGQVVNISGEAVPLLDENKTVTGYFGITQDITELHQNQIALVSASRMSSLGLMAAGIAHEINNPLTIVMGKAMVLEKSLSGNNALPLDEIRKNISQISQTAQRIAKIVNGLRFFSRDSSSDPKERFSIQQCIVDTISLCQKRFENNATNLQFVTEAKEDFFVNGYASQISQVILNLLSNAYDAVQDVDNKWVKIDVKKDKSKIYITVSDSGPGLNSESVSKIFDPFFTTKAVGKGTGLGLSISKGIVENHGGRISVDPSVVPTMFVVELPLDENLN